MVLSCQGWLLCCVLLCGGYNIQCSQSVRITRIFLMSDAAPCILSAISTRLGSSLSPPFFSCHGDDVKLHHRFSPVDGLRGGATNPGQSTAGTVLLTSCLWVSAAPFPHLPLDEPSCPAAQNARNCAFTSRSVRKPDRGQGTFLIYFFFLCVVLHSGESFAGFHASTALTAAA